MSVINNNLLLTPEGYQISRSVRLRSSASAYFNRTPAGAGDRQKYTWSGWIKRGALPSSGNIGLFTVGATDAASDGLIFSGAGTLFLFFANATYSLNTSAILRDPSAWYHIVFSVDTTQATAANRVSLYVNGVQVTSFSAASYPTQNYNCYFNSAAIHAIGRQQQTSPSGYFDGYLTEVNFIDGQALTPSSFGETDPITGVWKPKKYSGTYGTNGFYLPFTDVATTSGSNAGLGKDFSGNGNYWNTNNISVTAGSTYDSMKDVPTLTDADTANYCVLNPLWKSSTASTSNGNLSLSQSTALEVNQSTISVSSGKWYWETTITSVGATVSPMIGVVNGGGLDSYTSANAYYYFSYDGKKFLGGTATAYGATYTNNDVIGVALDIDSGTLTFYKNGTSQGTAATALSGSFSPAFSNGGGPSPAWGASVNFGQRPFAYTPPTGFKALNTQNLPDSTIAKGNKQMDATLYTGNGSTQSVVNAGGFRPDLVWGKSRSAATENAVYDTVRGSGLYLITNTTGAEANAGSLGLSSFNSNGFSLGSGTGLNASGATYVGWQWKAGGTAVSNTSGSITSQVSANPTAGFSVVTYTGTGANATVGHGLGVAPSMIITARRSSGGAYWGVYHKSLGASQILYMQATNAATADSTTWNATTPTSSVFSVGVSAQSNSPAASTYVAYCWSEVAGYSKFGSYTGNGSTDGPFVYCGFRPRFVMIKETGATGNWNILDTSRSTYNAADKVLLANTSGAEIVTAGGAEPIDILSNGFKLRYGGSGDTNTNGGTYIFAAFAENPFKTSLAR